MFAYPKPEEKKDDKKLKATAVLSTTARASARQARKEARKAGVGSPPKPGTPGGDDPFAPVPLERQLSNASYISTVSIDPGADIELKSPKKEKEPSRFGFDASTTQANCWVVLTSGKIATGTPRTP